MALSVAQSHLRSVTAILTSRALRGGLNLPARLYTVTDILIASRWEGTRSGLARQPSVAISPIPMTLSSLLAALQAVLRPSCRLPTMTSQVVQAPEAPRLLAASLLTVTPPMVAPQVGVPPLAAPATSQRAGPIPTLPTPMDRTPTLSSPAARVMQVAKPSRPCVLRRPTLPSLDSFGSTTSSPVTSRRASRWAGSKAW